MKISYTTAQAPTHTSFEAITILHQKGEHGERYEFSLFKMHLLISFNFRSSLYANMALLYVVPLPTCLTPTNI